MSVSDRRVEDVERRRGWVAVESFNTYTETDFPLYSSLCPQMLLIQI